MAELPKDDIPFPCSAFFVGELIGLFGVETFMNRYGRRNIMNATFKDLFRHHFRESSDSMQCRP